MRTAAEIGGWWVAGMIIWTATLSTVDPPELLLAALAAVIMVPPAMLGRRAIGLRGRPRTVWIGWAGYAAVGAVLDCLRLVGWLTTGRREPELKRSIVVRRVPTGDAPTAVGRRQGAILAISATPGTLVLGCDPDHGIVLLHRLVGGWPELPDRVSRPDPVEPGQVGR